MKKVSIIVPVYNVEKYIEKTILSLVNQDYKNIEIILIDDGSNDCSAMILEQAKDIDKRIIVLHQTNKGVSAARNLGLSVATGEFVMFVDGDDYVEHNYVSYFLDKIVNYSCRTCFNRSNYSNDLHSGSRKKAAKILDSLKAAELIYLGFIFVAVWNKIYDLNVIRDNKIIFDESIWYGEGMLFNMHYLQYVDKVLIVDYDLYHQVSNPNSAMRRFSLESNYCGIQSLNLQKPLFKTWNHRLEKAWNYHRWCFNITIASGLFGTRSLDNHKQEFANCVEHIKRGWYTPLLVPISFHEKSRLLCFAFFPMSMLKRHYNKLR